MYWPCPVLFGKFDLQQVLDRASSFQRQHKKGIHSMELLAMLEVLLLAAMLEILLLLLLDFLWALRILESCLVLEEM